MSNYRNNNYRRSPANRRKKPGFRIAPRFWLFLLVLVLAIAGIWGLISLIAGGKGSDSSKGNPAKISAEQIAYGVMINDIDVGGMTTEQARQAIGVPLDNMLLDMRFKFTYESHFWTLAAEDLNVQHNADLIILQALECGKAEDGSVDKDETVYISQNGEKFYTDLSYDAMLLHAELDAIAGELGTPAVNAQMVFHPDADSQSEMFEIIPGQEGISVNTESAAAELDAKLALGGEIVIPLSVTTGQPEITEELLQQATKPLVYLEEDDELVSHAFYTKVGGSRARRANVKLALSQFNGLVLQPGEELSFNAVTGERTADNGYQEAPGIAGDKSYEPTYGGGVCQASTTLYNAALCAGLDITERNKHSIPSSYVRTGFDAMVNWPDKDLKFVNNTDAPICIQTWYDDDRAYVQIYGKPLEEGVAYRRVSTEVEKILAGEEIEYRVDTEGTYVEFIQYADEEYVYRAASDGVRVQASLEKVNLSTGEVLSTTVLHTDYYKPITAIIYTGALDPALRPIDGTAASPSPETSTTPTPPAENDGNSEGSSDGDGEGENTETPAPDEGSGGDDSGGTQDETPE